MRSFFLADGFLPGEVFPPLDRHIDVGWVDLDGVDAAPLLLASNECGARPDERIVDVALVVVDGPLHALDRLLAEWPVSDFLGLSISQTVEAFQSPFQLACVALLDGVPAWLVPPVVVPTTDHDVPLVPDNKSARSEATYLQPSGSYRKKQAGNPNVSDPSREEHVRSLPVCALSSFVDLPNAPSFELIPDLYRQDES